MSALPTTNLVCGMGPSAASTSTMAPSTIDRMRSTSPPKSAWPGVSTILMRVSFQTTEVALARMVMPRSFSRSLESMTRSATRWLSRNDPDCFRSSSTSVVLPWSTWAMIAMLRRVMFSLFGVSSGRCRTGARHHICGAHTAFSAFAKVAAAAGRPCAGEERRPRGPTICRAAGRIDPRAATCNINRNRRAVRGRGDASAAAGTTKGCARR